MDYSIQAEYGSLLAREQFIRVQLNELPIGYISKKTIKGNPQYYLQRRVGEKMTGVYIRADEVQNVREALERRAQYESEKKQISARLEQLEQAAKLIGQELPCRFMVMKLSTGMDELQPERRKHCTSFASAMNGVLWSAQKLQKKYSSGTAEKKPFKRCLKTYYGTMVFRRRGRYERSVFV